MTETPRTIICDMIEPKCHVTILSMTEEEVIEFPDLDILGALLQAKMGLLMGCQVKITPKPARIHGEMAKNGGNLLTRLRKLKLEQLPKGSGEL